MIERFVTWLAGNNAREMVARIITCCSLVLFLVIMFCILLVTYFLLIVPH